MTGYKRYGTSVRTFANADPERQATPAQRDEIQSALAEIVELLNRSSDPSVQLSIVVSAMVTFCMAAPQPFAAADHLLEIFEEHLGLLLTRAEGNA